MYYPQNYLCIRYIVKLISNVKICCIKMFTIIYGMLGLSMTGRGVQW